MDLLKLGNKLYWFNLVGDSISRLDLSLVSNGLIELWSLKGKFIGNRSFSDHCEISIKANRWD